MTKCPTCGEEATFKIQGESKPSICQWCADNIPAAIVFIARGTQRGCEIDDITYTKDNWHTFPKIQARLKSLGKDFLQITAETKTCTCKKDCNHCKYYSLLHSRCDMNDGFPKFNKDGKCTDYKCFHTE